MEVGTPSVSLSGWTTTEVRFHGFANLSATRDNENKVKSPEFSCFGHQWTLVLYPGGRSISDEGYAAVSLCNRSNTRIKIQYGFSVRDADGKEVVYKESKTNEFGALGAGSNAWNIYDFAKRSKLIKALSDGSLVIEVRMKTLTSTSKSVTQFVPSNPFNKNVDKLFMDEETADVVFEVGGEQQTNDRRKRAKTSTTNFYAHKLILKNNASTLYEMCGVVDRGEITTVSITDVSPGIFKHMIYYAYGGKLSDEDLNNNAKDVINACDKYGVVNLKLEAEACYVKSTEITMDNMMDILLYADSKNLALLKEAVMDYIVANKGDILGKVSFDNVPGSTVSDVLAAMREGSKVEMGIVQIITR